VKGRAGITERLQANPAAGLNPSAVLMGIIVAFAASLIMAAILALVLYFSSISEGLVEMATGFLGMFSIFLGAGYAARKAETYGWVHGAVTGFLYVAICYVVGLFFAPDLLPGSELFFKMVIGVLVGVLGGIVGINL